MTYYSQDRNTADVRKKRDFGGFAMFCGTFNDAGRIADRQVKSGTVPQNAGHLAALGVALFSYKYTEGYPIYKVEIKDFYPVQWSS